MFVLNDLILECILELMLPSLFSGRRWRRSPSQ